MADPLLNKGASGFEGVEGHPAFAWDAVVKVDVKVIGVELVVLESTLVDAKADR